MSVGFCLEGGGADGGRQIGAMYELIDHGHTPDYLVGSSIGGIISGVYGTLVWHKGMDEKQAVDRLYKMWRTIRLEDIVSPSLFGLPVPRFALWKSLFVNKIRSKVIEMVGGDHSLEGIPVSITGSDLYRGRQIELSNCSLSEACSITACIPGVFEPVRGRFVDGGVTGNAPLSYLRDRTDRAVVFRVGSADRYNVKNYWWRVLFRSWMVSISAGERSEIEDNRDYFDSLDVIDLSQCGESGMLELTEENARKTFQEGRKVAKNLLRQGEFDDE